VYTHYIRGARRCRYDDNTVIAGSGLARYVSIQGSSEKNGYKRVRKDLFSGKEVYTFSSQIKKHSQTDQTEVDNKVTLNDRDSVIEKKRKTQLNKQPTIPLHFSQLPEVQEDSTENYFAILEKNNNHRPIYI
jgi:hypothetical protein